ncbi:HNH endonuclease [Streptomyces noursei]
MTAVVQAREFFAADPSPRASWRMAVLMGRNSRTYKFALGHALLQLAGQGRAEVSLADLAVPYALSLAERATDAPQAPEGSAGGATDFLTVLGRAGAESLRLGHPTEELLAAAVRSMPVMVMQKFHNLSGDALGHRFYELGPGTGGRRTVRFTDALRSIAGSEQAPGLGTELGARWRIVENSFDTGIGRSLITDGLSIDGTTLYLTDRRRRRPIAHLTPAVIGFQHHRCLICDDVIVPGAPVQVDHVFPRALMTRYGTVRPWPGPDLDLLWNLAPAHEACNGAKSDRMPKDVELMRLARRNTAIMSSPHPLRRTLQLQIRTPPGTSHAGDWPMFLRAVRTLVT